MSFPRLSRQRGYVLIYSVRPSIDLFLREKKRKRVEVKKDDSLARPRATDLTFRPNDRSRRARIDAFLLFLQKHYHLYIFPLVPTGRFNLQDIRKAEFLTLFNTKKEKKDTDKFSARLIIVERGSKIETRGLKKE